jgi:transposase
MGQAVIAIVRTLSATLAAIYELGKALDEHFDAHPDAPILRSMPGLGLILGARVLGEFGDDPTGFPDAASRRAYAGTAPITRASEKLKLVLLRRAGNHRLTQTCRWWAFTATQRSPGAKAYYRSPQRRRQPRSSPAAAGQQTARPVAPLPGPSRTLRRTTRLATARKRSH